MRYAATLSCIALACLGFAAAAFHSDAVPMPVEGRERNEPDGGPGARAAVGSATSPPGYRVDAAPAASAAFVRIVDARDGSPLSGATVRFAASRDKPIQWSPASTAVDGRAPLPSPAPVAVMAEAAGYAPVLVAWPSRTDDVLALQPAAALRLEFVDARGEPVAGVGARLLPPEVSAGAEWAAEWIAERWSTPRSSGADGVVEFTGLRADRAWRWAVASPHAVDVEPPHESRGGPVGDAVRVRAGRQIRDVSGLLALTAGETTEIVVTAASLGAIVGRITVPGAALRPQIRLYHLDAVESPHTEGGPRRGGVARVTQSGFTTTAEDGAFGFLGVRPGPKIIRAYWRDTPQSYAFVTRTVPLAAGERHDLGEVRPLAGEARVRVRLADRAGRTLAPDEVLGGAEPTAMVLVEAWRQRGNFVDSIFDVVPVPLGREVRLRGFCEGTLGLRGQLGSDWPRLEGGRRILEAPMTEFVLPVTGRIELTMTVESRVRRELVLLTPSEAAPALELWLRPVRGGNAERMRVRAAPPGAGRRVSVSVLPEPYELLLCTKAADDGLGLAALTRVDFGQETPRPVQLKTGAAIEGVCSTVDGTAWAERSIYFTIDGWRHEDQAAWLFRARTDAGGRFVLPSLPPATRLVGAHAGMTLTSPAPGARDSVQLTVMQ